jgi:TolB protein
VALLAVSFGAIMWDNIFPLHGATASQNPAHAIAFTQHQNGRSQIYSVDSDGQNLRQITAEEANATQASWSADGERLVFVNDIDGHEQIYCIDATGTRESRLTNDNQRDIAPSWSPGNLKIAYLGIDGSDSAIWIINPDGTSSFKATNPSQTGAVFAPLAWAPDGHQIAFASGPSGRANIMLLTPKTGMVKQLTNLPGYATNPAWSPDGTTLVFTVATSDRSTIHSVLYTIHADGTGLTQITNGNVQDGRPTWSPDGSHIAFVRMAHQRSALFVVDDNGSNVRRLTLAPTGQILDFPSWAPDGGSILFVRQAFPSSPRDTATLEAIDTGGDNLRTLATTLAPASWPVFRPATRPAP